MRKLNSAATETIQKRYFYPFLFAVYPALFLYLRNIREVLPGQLLLVLVISLAVALIYWPVTWLLTRHHEKRALLLFLFLWLFHFYGLFYEWIAGLLPRASLPFLSYAIAFILPGGGWILLSWIVVRSIRNFTTVNRILNLVVMVLVIWNMTGILIYHGQSWLNRNRMQPEKNAGLLKNDEYRGARPDIYCFVLDEFASLESARSLFQYDNSIFAETLQKQGFFVAQRSRSRFRLTEPAIADILNLGEFVNNADPFPLIRRNAVASFLQQRGYRIIEFPVMPALFMEAADQRFHYSLTHASIFFDDFYRILFERSLLRFLPDSWQRQKADFSRFYRERVLHVFARLPEVVRSPGPKFVFIHVFSPHEPFVFNERGEKVPAAHFWDHDDPRFYLQQYKFISSKMVETVSLLLNTSPAAPVIIIQSDHGYRGSLRLAKQQSRVAGTEMFKVFNALHLPGVDPKQIPLSLSPRNNFRLVFNHYFAEHFPLLQNP